MVIKIVHMVTVNQQIVTEKSGIRNHNNKNKKY